MFTLDTGNTAWMIVATALVLLMTPGLAFFYGGMVRAKSVLNMMMMSFISIGTIAVIWVVYAYGLAFGTDTAGGLIGSPSGFVGVNGLDDAIDRCNTYAEAGADVVFVDAPRSREDLREIIRRVDATETAEVLSAIS